MKDLSKLHSVIDGVEEIPAKDFHSFPSIIRGRTAKSHLLHIPLPIAEKLKLKRGDFIEVAIRKVNKKYVTENYLSESWMPYWNALAKRYRCPVCGKPGRIKINRYGGRRGKPMQYFAVHIAHCKVDGFSGLTYHLVKRKDHPRFWMQHVKAHYPNSIPKGQYDNW